MIMGSRALSLCVALSALSASGAAPAVVWSHCYGGPGVDLCRTGCVTAGGSIVVAGYTRTPPYSDALLIKMDLDGDTLWSRTFGDTTAQETIYSMRPTADHGFLIAGGVTPAYNQNDLCLIKVDSTGRQEWHRVSGVTDVTEMAYWAEPTADRGCVVVGTIRSTEVAGLLVCKADSQGVTSDTAVFGWGGSTYPHCIRPTPDGGYAIVGETSAFGVPADRGFLLKLDAGLDSQWTVFYGDTTDERVHNLVCTSDRGFLLVGARAMNGSCSNCHDVHLTRTDSLGRVVWSRLYGSPYHEVGFHAMELADKGYVVSGSGPLPRGSFDFYVIRTDSLGDTLWTTHAGGAGFDEGMWVDTLPGGGFVVAGTVDTCTLGEDDLLVMRLAGESGTRQVAPRAAAAAPGLAVRPAAGHGVLVGFALVRPGDVRLLIHALSGAEVACLPPISLAAGRHTVAWDGCDSRGRPVARGTYLCSLLAGAAIRQTTFVLPR